MAGEYDREGFWNIISHVWERPPLNVLRTMIFGSDGTSAVAIKVTDNGTVVVTGGTGGGGGGDGAILDGVSAAIKATVFDYATSNPLAATLVDTNGDPVSVGGGTQYAEDTVAAAAEMLTMAGVVRKDTAASLVNLDGDRTELQVDANGRLHTIGLVTGTVTTTVASMPAITGIVTANVGLGTWPITGTVTANAGLGTYQVAGIVTANAGLGTWQIAGIVTAHVGLGTQAISGIVTANAGLGTWAVAGIVTANAGLGTWLVNTELLVEDLDTDSGTVASTTLQAVVGLVYGGSGQAILVSDVNPLPVTGTFTIPNTVTVQDNAPGGVATTNVSASATSVTLLAADQRYMASFFNDSTSACYLKLGATASTTSFTVLMRAGDYYELPYRYDGVIDAIWVSAAGAMRCSEWQV